MSQKTTSSESAAPTKAEPTSIEIPRSHRATVSQAVRAVGGSPLPPIPVPSSSSDLPPIESAHMVLSDSGTRLGLFFEATKGGGSGWVADAPNTSFPGSAVTLVNYDGSWTAPDYKLTLRRFWRRKEYTQVPPGQSFSQTYELQYGVSTTNSVTLSAELGVEAAGLSAKLTATFEQSITVSTQSTASVTYGDTAPAGSLDVWVLWQLVDEVVALGPATKEPIDPYHAFATLTDPTPGNWDAKVSIYHPVTRLPYDIFVPHVTSFPAA